MLVHPSLFSVLLLSISLPVEATVIRRDPPVNFPLKKRLNLGPFTNLVARDRARVQSLRSHAKNITDLLAGILPRDTVHNEPVVNNVVFYLASIGVGTPPKTYELLVDTGSSNTWVGAQSDNPYQPTNSSVKTPNTVSVQYGSGFFSGTEYLDTVTLASDLVLHNQSIGAADRSEGLTVDGILGSGILYIILNRAHFAVTSSIGPKGLTLGTLSPNRTQTIDTVTDTAFAQGLIGQNEIGVYFEPIASPSNTGGQLTYGGVDESKFIEPLTFADVTSVPPANAYWGIEQSIQYGSQKLLTGSSGVVDTGTTLMLIATDAFKAYQNASGADEDPVTGLLRISPDNFNQLQNLTFQISGTNFDLVPDAQIWPRSLNTDIGGSDDYLYLIVGDIGEPSGSGLDFINGYTFLERFYTSFDTDNKRVGFARTNYTDSSVNF